MKEWKIRYQLLKNKVFQTVFFYAYKLKSVIGIKTLGYGKNDGLVILKILKNHFPASSKVMIAKVTSDLGATEIPPIHDAMARTNGTEYISILFNPDKRQVDLFVGNNLAQYLNQTKKEEIKRIMKNKFDNGEIIKGVDLGLKKVKEYLSV